MDDLDPRDILSRAEMRVAERRAGELEDLLPAELGVAFDVATQSARSMVADVLDLQHRLPLVWAAARPHRAR